MAKPTTLGGVIREIAKGHGEKALLDSQLTLAVFMDLAPELKKEKELLRSFLLCNGAEKIISVKMQSEDIQEACMNSIVKELEESHWLSKDAAKYVCAEFYRGITDRKWSFAPNIIVDPVSPVALDVYRSMTIHNSDIHAKRSVPVDVDGKIVNITIPESVTSGQTVRFPGKGRYDQLTGKVGDLYITVYIFTNQSKKNLIGIVIVAIAVVAIIIAMIITNGDKPQHASGPNAVVNIPTSPKDTHTHEWQTATCTKPKTCSTCGETSGNVAGHQWMNATYTTPKTCSVCNQTEGVSLGVPLNKCVVIEDSQSSVGTDIITGTLMDVSGNKHENAVMFWVSDAGNYINIEHIVYGINREYDILEGSISLGEDSASGAAVRFYIYGDGNLIYKSDYISGAQEKTLSIDVSGVSELRIECETDEKCNCYGIITAMLYVD